jgi:hypothetical protein
MAKISKALAESIVNKVIEKLQKKEDEYNDAFCNKAREYYVNRIPKEIMEIFNVAECKSFISKTSSFYVNGMGFNNYYTYVTPPVPNRKKADKNRTDSYTHRSRYNKKSSGTAAGSCIVFTS